MIPEYTIVCGVDAKHLQRLAAVWPSWKLHKPSLLSYPMVVFYDCTQLEPGQIEKIIDHPNLRLYSWPPPGVVYQGESLTTGTDRERYDAMWNDPQRQKMMAGFVHVPPIMVHTPYWLKLDSCVYADGQDDWIDPEWFKEDPWIVSHRWGYTKPGDQMLLLDKWASKHEIELPILRCHNPLNLIPEPGSDKVSHKRIIGWCAFFNTGFTTLCSALATSVNGVGQIPVPSQDGFMWYVAKRMGKGIKRVNMKNRGWLHRPVRDIPMSVLKQ